MARFYGFKPWDLERMTIPQVDAYLAEMKGIRMDEGQIQAHAIALVLQAGR